jgi:hypothetical protein
LPGCRSCRSASWIRSEKVFVGEGGRAGGRAHIPRGMLEQVVRAIHAHHAATDGTTIAFAVRPREADTA